MAIAAFDTLKYVKHLKQAGVSDEQAEAQAVALAEILQAGLQDFAKKSDLDNLESRLNGRIDKLASDLNGKTDKLESDLNGKIDKLDGKIDALENRLNGKIDLFRTELSGKIDAQRAEFMLMKWLLSGIFTGVVALVLRSFIFH